jgi:ketosteroid isomerase-like protein
MKKMFIPLTVFAMLLLLGCEQHQSSEPELIEQSSAISGTLQKSVFDKIVEANGNFMAAFSAQDDEAMAALYTQDAQLLPPNGDFQTGNAAVKAFWGSLFTAGFDGVILETLEVHGHGNIVSEVGLFTLFLNGQNFDNGKYIVVWKKVQGKWYLHRDIWNSSNPAQ